MMCDQDKEALRLGRMLLSTVWNNGQSGQAAEAQSFRNTNLALTEKPHQAMDQLEQSTGALALMDANDKPNNQQVACVAGNAVAQEAGNWNDWGNNQKEETYKMICQDTKEVEIRVKQNREVKFLKKTEAGDEPMEMAGMAKAIEMLPPKETKKVRNAKAMASAAFSSFSTPEVFKKLLPNLYGKKLPEPKKEVNPNANTMNLGTDPNHIIDYYLNRGRQDKKRDSSWLRTSNKSMLPFKKLKKREQLFDKYALNSKPSIKTFYNHCLAKNPFVVELPNKAPVTATATLSSLAAEKATAENAGPTATVTSPDGQSSVGGYKPVLGTMNTNEHYVCDQMDCEFATFDLFQLRLHQIAVHNIGHNKQLWPRTAYKNKRQE